MPAVAGKYCQLWLANYAGSDQQTLPAAASKHWQPFFLWPTFSLAIFLSSCLRTRTLEKSGVCDGHWRNLRCVTDIGETWVV